MEKTVDEFRYECGSFPHYFKAGERGVIQYMS